MNFNKSNKENNIDDLVDVLGKISTQATDSLVGQIVLVELLIEKGIISKGEYKNKLVKRNSEIKEKIIKNI